MKVIIRMSKRDFYFDNAKFILIFFVVFGHIIQSYIHDNSVITALYMTIYTFHMPAFTLVSGYFAKGFYKKGYVKKLAKKLLIPYLIFQVIYTIFYYFLYQEHTFQIEPFVPQWSLWFLLSLFFWNVLLILFVKIFQLKESLSLFISLILGLVVGCFEDHLDVLSFSRTFVFFPFFLLGFYLKKEHFSSIITTKARILFLMVLLTVLVSVYFHPNLNENWLLGSKSYAQLHSDNFTGMVLRIGIYAINILMVCCFFAFVPQRKFFFTHWGKNTLYVYLLHGFFVKTFRESDMKNSVESVILLLIVSFLLTVFLSSSYMTAVAQPIIEMKWGKLKKMILHLKKSSKYMES